MASIAASLAISLAVSAATAGLTYALTPTQKLEGNKLDSLTSSNSNYGTPIPWAWGTVRLPGTRIWQDYLEEVSTTKKSGKGSKVQTADHSYYGYYAEMFAACPFRPIVDFNRVWMNKKLIYSKVGGAETIASGGKFADQYLRFYKGEAAQDIDPLLQHTTPISNYNYGLPSNPTERDAFLRALGIDPTTAILSPAYNRRACIVAQRVPLEDFFNSLPKGEAEIVASENCTAGQIVGDIFSLYFEPERYDTSLIDDISVKGFSIDSVSAAKNAIQTLQQAYFFDIVDSNRTFKFIPLKHPRDVVNLTKSDLAAHTSGSQKPLDYEIIKKDPTTLPSKVIVKYIDPDLNYDVNEQQSSAEVKSHYNNNPITLSFNLVLSASEAATIADRAFILAWSQALTYKFQLPTAFLDLEPADTIPNLFDDQDYPIKITQTRIGANLILDCEGLPHENWLWDFVRVLEEGGLTVGVADYNIILETNGTPNTVADTSGTIYTEGTDYTVDSNGDIQILSTGSIASGTDLVISTTTQPSQSESDLGAIVTAGNTELLVLDIPLINDEDADYTLYLATGGGDAWTGASIYISTDNSRYIFADSTTSYSIYGTVDSDFSGGQITVKVNKSELESITDSDLALGFNLALIDNEIIQFKTAELIDINTYRLSDITRGLRGTEKEADPVVGDRFVLLTGESAAVTKINTGSAADIGQVRYFKAVSSGQALDEVFPIQITYQAIAQRPFAPNNLSATTNGVGDITIKWDRRDRHGLPNLSDVPEQYQIEIIDNSNNSIKRTVTISTNSYIYPIADQNTDFGAIQNTIYIKVAQLSPDYGVGTYTQKTELTPVHLEPLPTITSFTPASGLVGTTITITGTDLAQVNAIAIGDIIQDNLAVIDNENITFNIAPGTVSGNIIVNTDGGTAVSSNALIIEQPPQALVFPIGSAVTLPYTVTSTDAGLELIINAQTATLSIPDLDTGFPAGWGCWVSLDGTGAVAIERVSSGTSGILGTNSISDNQTVKLWHRGGNIWKID